MGQEHKMRDLIPPWAKSMVVNAGCHPAQVLKGLISRLKALSDGKRLHSGKRLRHAVPFVSIQICHWGGCTVAERPLLHNLYTQKYQPVSVS